MAAGKRLWPTAPKNPTPARRHADLPATAAPPSDRRPWPAHERAALDWLLPNATERRRHALSETQAHEAGVRDFLIVQADAPPPEEHLFDTLRWGGQLLIVGPHAQAVTDCRQRFAHSRSWCCEQPEHLPPPQPVPGAAAVHLCTVRKVGIELPGRLTARHSYEVSLVHRPGPEHTPLGPGSAGWAVEKRVPTHEETRARLIQTHPTIAPAQADGVVRWLVKTAFPLMLTRETAFLRRLQKYMPGHLAGRTPELLELHKDDRGLVNRIHMTWLRQGGETLTQIDFAQQAAEMLSAAHRHAGLMHLDVRLGNLVVTDLGVGLIDFGSSVMVDEDLSANRTVQKVIGRTLEASEITDNLQRHRHKGLLGNPLFDPLPTPPTVGFDLFALATCMTRPHDLADFRGLVAFEANSPDAIALSRLRRRVLSRAPGQPHAIADMHQLAQALGELAPQA